MKSLFVTFFYILLFLVAYTYLIYPVIIKIISMFYPTQEYKKQTLSVSILISAHNEETVIEDRIKNLAEQNLNFTQVEVLIGSDGSTDRTNELLLKMMNKYNWIKVFISEDRRGKTYVLNDLVDKANNDILVFTDANTIFEPDSVQKLIEGFIDNSIGGISGRLILEDQAESAGKGIKERSYWEYETFIKKSEGRCGILIGANGGIYAIRRKLFKPISVDKAVTDDFFITLTVLSQNLKFNYAANATAKETVGPDLKSEFRRKIRIASTNFQTLSLFTRLLFSNNLLLSFAFFSHKVVRWFAPLFLIFLIPLNIILLDNSYIFKMIFIIQIIFYSLALSGLFLHLLDLKQKFLSLFSYFLLTNLALLLGFVKYLQGKHSAIWESTPR